eukprot:8728031-Pyramimonas_sp.AAC.1
MVDPHPSFPRRAWGCAVAQGRGAPRVTYRGGTPKGVSLSEGSVPAASEMSERAARQCACCARHAKVYVA